MELGILHNSPPSTKRGCHAGRLHRLWHGLPPAPWPCTRSQHHSVPSRNLHPLMVPPFLQPHPDLQSAVGNAPLSSKHPAQLPTTDCLLSIISPMGGQPSDTPALSPPSPLQQGGQSSNAPALSPPSPLPQGGQPIALALSPPSPPPQGGQPSDAPGLSPSSSTLLLCPSDSTLNICHLNSQSAVKTAMEVPPARVEDYVPRSVLDKVFLGYYLFQIVSTLGLDMQGTLPAFLYPSWVKYFHTHHLETWRDPWLANTWDHPWYLSICMWEYFLHVPFYFVAAYCYYCRINNTDRCPWIRTPVIMYCTQTMTAVSSVVLMALFADFTHTTALAPESLFQRLKLAGMYGTFFVFCLLNLLDALTGRDYLQPPSATPAVSASAASSSRNHQD
ncbi:hypothetical protein ACOMHN_060860 [Nucella lapillus]